MLGLYLPLWFGLQLMQVVALIWLVQVIHLSPSLSTWILLPFQISALAGLQIWAWCRTAVDAWWPALGWRPLDRCVPVVNGVCSSGPRCQRMGPRPPDRLDLPGGHWCLHRLSDSWSLLPDAIDADPAHPAGMYTAWMVLGQKLIIGLSMSVFGGLLSLTGYISSQTCDGALNFIEQPDTALLAIRLCMGLIPAGLVAIGLMVMRRWPDPSALQHSEPLTRR